MQKLLIMTASIHAYTLFILFYFKSYIFRKDSKFPLK